MKQLPWLELSILLPLLGATCVSRWRDPQRALRWCLGFSVVTLACAVGAWLSFAWPPREAGSVLAAHHLGSGPLAIDELSAPLLPLVALLHLLVATATLSTKMRRFSFAGTLVSESIALATVSCQAPWCIIALLAGATVPPWLELRGRTKSARVFAVHMILFIALLVIGGALVELQERGHVQTWWAVLPLAAAVLVRSGIVPVHCWMTDLFEHATFGTALLFVTPMTGAYAAVRLVLPIAPEEVLHGIGLLSLATAVYAAGMALVQREARRFFCYLFLSHSALVLVGLEIATPIGLTGALVVWLAVALSLTGFGLTLRAIEARTGRLSLTAFHGLYEHMPMLAVFFLLTGLASVGFPGTLGYLGTELLVEGAVEAYPYVGMAVVVAAALNGIAVVKAFFQVFTGARHASAVDLRIGRRERFAVLTLTLVILGTGLLPQPGISSRNQAAMQIVSDRQQLGRGP